MVDVSPTAGMAVDMSTERDPHRLFLKVCMANQMRPDIVRGPRRDKAAVRVRRKVARVLRDAGCSFPEIGRILGGRHHTSVMNLLNPEMRQRKYLRRQGCSVDSWRAA
jgi:chromosomal replication initiation ATPase DnaA